MVRISIRPKPALVDAVLKITVSHLQPGQKVTLRSRVSEANHRFYGYAQLRANADGVIHNNMMSEGGTYTGDYSIVLDHRTFQN